MTLRKFKLIIECWSYSFVECNLTHRVVLSRARVLRQLAQGDRDWILDHCCSPHRWSSISYDLLLSYQRLRTSSWPTQILLPAETRLARSGLTVSQTLILQAYRCFCRQSTLLSVQYFLACAGLAQALRPPTTHGLLLRLRLHHIGELCLDHLQGLFLISHSFLIFFIF